MKHDEKDDGKKSGLAAGLKKLSHEQLAELHDAVSAELKRRAQDKADNKKPSEMTDAEFRAWSKKQFEKYSEGDSRE